MTEYDDALKQRAKDEVVIYEGITADQKAETDAVEKALGRKLNQKDSEYWQIAEKYRQRYFSEIVAPRDSIMKAKRKAEKDQTVDPLSKPSQGERFCVVEGCGKIIVPSGKRGRPATKCEEHRATNTTTKKAKSNDKVEEYELIEL